MAGDALQQTVEERIKAILIKCLGVEENEIMSESSFVDDLGADSLDVSEIIMTMEDEFDIAVHDEDAEDIKTFRQAVVYVEKKIVEKKEGD